LDFVIYFPFFLHYKSKISFFSGAFIFHEPSTSKNNSIRPCKNGRRHFIDPFHISRAYKIMHAVPWRTSLTNIGVPGDDKMAIDQHLSVSHLSAELPAPSPPSA
jgi:hypothetical protein